jgi:transposase
MGTEILGGERRRKWSLDDKARLIGETLVPGQTVTAVAERNGIARSVLFGWRRKARAASKAGLSFIPVHVKNLDTPELPHPVPAKAAGRPRGLIEIRLCDGRSVIVDQSVEAANLRRVLEVLAAR